MISFVNNLLDKDEFIFLKEKMTDNLNDFTIKPDKVKLTYYKTDIFKQKNSLLNYYSKISRYVDLNIFDISFISLNCATDDTNSEDTFHRDNCDRTVITYLNNNFKGGELQYILNEETKLFNPIENMTIIFNSKIKHRILPVKEGFRYSLVTFFVLKPTNIIKLF